MSEFVHLLVAGIATGAIYALVAVGFTLLWQTSQTINFAQGEFVMLPAFFVLAGTDVLGLPFWASVLLAFVLALLILGLLFERAIVAPLLPHGVVPLVIATIALGLLLKESVKTFYSAEAQPFPPLAGGGTVYLGMVSAQDLLVIAVAGGVVLLLQLFLHRTRTGRQMQATAQNRGVAEILGIPVRRMVLLTFLLNAALVTLASLLVSPIYLAKFDNGETLGLVAFIAAIVGGFNRPGGAVAGGFLVGIVDNLAAAYVSAAYRTGVLVLLLIAFILLRPQGLFGRLEERTV